MWKIERERGRRKREKERERMAKNTREKVGGEEVKVQENNLKRENYIRRQKSENGRGR